jgi:hypothetical protein
MPRCWPTFRFRSGNGAVSPTKPEELPDNRSTHSGPDSSSGSGSTTEAEAEAEHQPVAEGQDKKKKKMKKDKKMKKKIHKDEEDTKTESKASEDKDDDKKDKKPKVPVGSVSEAKHIYKGASDDDGNWTWVDKYPDDVEEAAENEETATYAVVVRNQKSNDSRKKLEAHSIIVQSPQLRAALSEILANYPGVACELTRLEFEAPFKPFVHRW